MPDRPTIGLDDPAFSGRLRQPITGGSRSFRVDSTRQVRASSKYFNNDIMLGKNGIPRPVAVAEEVTPLPPPQPEQKPQPVTAYEKPTSPPILASPVTLVRPEPFAAPAQSKTRPTKVLARATVTRPRISPFTPSVPKELPSKRSRPQTALMAMAVLVFIVGIFVSVMTLQTNHNARTQVAALAQKTANSSDGSGDVPSESKPGNIGGYQVAPDLPKYIKIPSLNVNARVKPMGVTSSNELQAPSNIFDAGWYNASAHPGDDGGNGAVLIDGHVHGPSLPGVFVAIKSLRAGDVIEIVRGDNKVFSYTVVKTQQYSAANLNLGVALGSVQPGKPGLNLITCGGTYDHSAQQYTERTIVFAVAQS